MEFQAYSSSPPAQKAGNMRAVWSIHNIIHGGCSSVLPIVILTAACCLVLYQHMTAKEADHFAIRTFLALIVVSMTPLALLEKKLLSCSDPLGLLYKFSGKVILMQTIQLSLRVGAGIYLPDFASGFLSTNCILLVSAVVLLPTIFGLRPTKQWIVEQRDVMLLAVLAFSFAVFTEIADGYQGYQSLFNKSLMTRHILNSITQASDYLELVSFVPAVWMVCRDKELKEVDVNAARKRATALIAFLLSFYFIEDVVAAWVLLGSSLPLAVMGHTAHFLLVVDFALYFSAHLFDPEKFEKVMGKICDMFADACSV